MGRARENSRLLFGNRKLLMTMERAEVAVMTIYLRVREWPKEASDE